MQTDPALPIAVRLIAGFEAFRANPYLDNGRKVPTNGYGFTTMPNGKPVTMAAPPITQADAYERLTNMVARTLGMVRNMVYISLSSNAAAALTSFAYNDGTNALRTSTLLKLLNQGENVEASRQFGAWVYAGGHIDAGLKNRRATEEALFLTPDTEVADPDTNPEVTT